MVDRPNRSPRDRLISLVEQILTTSGMSREISVEDPLTQIGLTSINMVSLMLAVEAEFDLALPPAEITPENFRSISTVEAMVKKLSAGPG